MDNLHNKIHVLDCLNEVQDYSTAHENFIGRPEFFQPGSSAFPLKPSEILEHFRPSFVKISAAICDLPPAPHKVKISQSLLIFRSSNSF